MEVQEQGNYILTDMQPPKKRVEQCMEEVQEILNKHKCEIICVPQKIYGQTIYAPMITEIK